MQNARNMRIVHQSAQNMCVVHLADRPGGGRRRFSRPAAALPPLPCAPARSKMRIAGRRERRRRPRRIPPPRLRNRASNLGRPIKSRPEIRARDLTPARDPPRGAGGLRPARRAQASERCRQPIGPRARSRRQTRIACAGRLRPAKRPLAALAGRRDGPSPPLPAPGGPHGSRARARRHSPRIPCVFPARPPAFFASRRIVTC